MEFPEAKLNIIGEDGCLYYKVGDAFRLSGHGLSCPPGKATCLILVQSLMEILVKYGKMDKARRSVFDCGGCKAGLIKFEYKGEKRKLFSKKPDNYIGALVKLLGHFSIFKSLDEREIKDIVSFLRLDKFDKGDFIIKKGEPGKKLFIMVAGKVEVLGDHNICIASLGKGEVFGEMSLLSGEPVVATIKVSEPTKVLYLNGEYFRKVLKNFPSLQIYLARLLVRRLAKMNMAQFEDAATGISGKLSEIPPAGLFQTINLNQKTGVISMALSNGSANLHFRDGELIRASYNDKGGQEAFFALLREREGRFKFLPGLAQEEMDAPILGSFMGLLMEGLRQIDEAAS
ncbi:MAG: hypothetical protein B6245_14165 [Desulfobacteraceae bacterium 4572_88]|nr:MAG: hypothetical protein B6245_14165 [Desulfobacteraceae bacterium 4572_88]